MNQSPDKTEGKDNHTSATRNQIANQIRKKSKQENNVRLQRHSISSGLFLIATTASGKAKSSKKKTTTQRAENKFASLA